MDIVATLIELKPRSADTIEAWAGYMERHRVAAEQTLRAEGVTIESWFAVTLAGKDYLLCYMRAASIAAAHAVAARSEGPVDKHHQQFKQSVWKKGRRAHCRLLVDLRAGREPAPS